jgi:hypothetical protein
MARTQEWNPRGLPYRKIINIKPVTSSTLTRHVVILRK